MVRNVTFTDASRKFQSLSGLETLTVADKFFLLNSFNRSALNAYHESNLWPRFLRVGEKRTLSYEPISTVTYDYPTTIKLKIPSNPDPANYPNPEGWEFDIFGISLSDITFELGKFIGGNPAWYYTAPNGRVVVIAKDYDSFYFGVYLLPQESGRPDDLLAITPYGFLDSDNDNLVLNSWYTDAYSAVQSVYYRYINATYTSSITVDSIIELSYNGNSSSQSTIFADNVVPYAELNKEEIGEFIRIHRDKPYGDIGTYEYDFYVDSNGANIMNLESGVINVYVTYKKSYNPSFTEESSDIPQEFLDYMLFTALGDFYTGDGQTENAAVAYNRAEQSLSSELFRLEQKNNRNVMGFKIATHHTRQLR
jgi:hypothetical protein